MTDASLRRILAAGLVEKFPHWSTRELLAAGLRSDRAAQIAAEQTDPIDVAPTLRRLGIHVLTTNDAAYPTRLQHIHAPPPVLYVRGSVDVLNKPALAVVGTRVPSPYGVAMTRRLTEPVAKHGLTIVSGLATGIDAIAHQAALDTNGTTIAVFGTGINRVYPAHHRALAEKIIASGGAVVTEFPLGTPVAREHFPRRNRIISGLSQATLVVEAGSRSGALITARFAVEQNRELLAVPGPIDAPTSVGPNNWIRLGATLVRSAEDILEAMGLPALTHKAWRPAPEAKETLAQHTITDPTQRIVFALLSNEPEHIDEITEKSRLDSSLVSATLSLMEINGVVQHVGGQFYRRAV